jgi:flagellin-like protein
MPNKGVGKRKAVSPVIATLLLIAIAVAVAIIAYSWITGLAGGLMGGGGQQVTHQLVLEAYDHSNVAQGNTITISVRYVGPASSVTISSIYYDGQSVTVSPTLPKDISIGNSQTFTITLPSNVARGTSHVITLVTSDGAKLQFSVIAGRTG